MLFEEDEIRVGVPGGSEERAKDLSILAGHPVRTVLNNVAVLCRKFSKLVA